ncbi:MAG TPA: NAD(P)-dependent oxidoreductase [Candidatus Obscuribacterales bacterium]
MILLTGATGCTGSYLLETLLAETGQDVIAWVRDPARLQIRSHPRLRIWDGGLEALDAYRSELSQVSALIHAATVWGGPETFAINLRQTRRLIQALEPAVCRQLHLFSTASLLDSSGRPWPQALRLGTDYIRSKATLHDWLASSPQQITPSLYYPTVILGGDNSHPYSSVGAALPRLPIWLPWARWLRAGGRLHLIHARDIARIVVHRLEHRLPPAQLVLGNPALSIDDLITQLVQIYGQQPVPLQLPLEPLLPALVQILKPWMSPWDRFSLQQRETMYQVVNAASYGLPEDLLSLEAMVKEVNS